MTVVVITDLTTDEARQRSDGEMVLSVTTTQASPEYARNLTDRIKVALNRDWEMIKEAYFTRTPAALGYSSWDDYCKSEFGTSQIRIPREDRPEAVRSLRDAGFSIRAIASATGVDRNTVRNDLRAGGGNSPTSTAAPAVKSSQTASVAAPEASAPPEPKTVTGTDGKTYAPKAKTEPAPEPKPARKTNRKALPKQFDHAGWELRKSVERLQRLAADDRFDTNKEAVAPHLRGHLTNAIEVCQDLLDRLN